MIPIGKRVRAWLALAAFVCGFGLPLATANHLPVSDDAACGLSVTGSPAGEPGTRLQGAGETAAADHCLLCHFQRAVGGASPSRPAGIPAPARASRGVSASPGRESGQARSHSPSRAPPTLL